MSLIQNIEACIDFQIKHYISLISKKYKLNSNELDSLWVEVKSNSTSTSQTKVEEPEIKTQTPLTYEAIAIADCAKLKAFCKDYSLPVGGKKVDLVSRLTDKLNSLCLATPPQSEGKTVAPTKPAIGRPTSKASKQSLITSKPVFKVIEQPPLAIRTNKFGNLEHPETKLVFNKDKIVIKKQLDDGKVADLNDDDIQECKKFGFKYIIENLDTGTELTKNKEVEDLVEDEIDENAVEDIEVEEDEEIQTDEEVEDEELEID